MRIFLIFSLLFIFFSCSDDQISQMNFPNKTFIEFDWCIYKSNYDADDLVEIFIDYKNILQNRNLSSSYLNPLFDPEDYNFIKMDGFENKKDYLEFLNFKDKNQYRRWQKKFDEVASCSESEKQFFYDFSNKKIDALKHKNKSMEMSFCKKLPNIELSQIVDNLEVLETNNELDIYILAPEISNDYYDYLFLLLFKNDRAIDEDFLSENFSFLVNCQTPFTKLNEKKITFDNYPLI